MFDHVNKCCSSYCFGSPTNQENCLINIYFINVQFTMFLFVASTNDLLIQADAGGSGVASLQSTGLPSGAEQLVMKIPNNKVISC